MLLLRQTTKRSPGLGSPCGCRGPGKHLIVTELGVDWLHWVDAFSASEIALVARRDGERAREFGHRVIQRLRHQAPRCAVLVVAGASDRESMDARARIGRALAVSMERKGGTLFIAGTSGSERAAAALADALRMAAPVNVRVVCMPAVELDELRAA